jgi:putative addiction module component (TIGR02574 family)
LIETLEAGGLEVTMITKNEVLASALELSETDRAELAHDLLRSIEPTNTELGVDHKRAWADEIERRFQRYQSGESQPIPADAVMSRIRDRLNARRSS